MKPLFLNDLRPSLVSLTGEDANFPLSQAANNQPSVVARSGSSGSVSLLFEFASAVDVDCAALLFHDLPKTAGLRLRGALTRAAVTAAPIIDQTVGAWISPDSDGLVTALGYSHGVALLPAPVTARYFQIDITGVPIGGFQFGRFMMGQSVRSVRSLDFGYGVGIEDSGRVTTLTSGARVSIYGQRRPILSWQLSHESADSVLGVLHPFMMTVGETVPHLVILDPDDASKSFSYMAYGLSQRVRPVINHKFRKYKQSFQLVSL